MSNMYWAFISLLALGCSNVPVPQALEISQQGAATTDARLRVITSTGIGEFSRPGHIDPLRAVCTEPSPDVAVATANSFSAGLSIFAQGSGSFSASQVETLAALAERTASIQLVRDKMYQTCLAYANGAISGTTYTLIMSQLDDTIVTLLLGETAGGAFGRSGATIGTAASSSAEASLTGPSAAIDGLQDAASKFGEAQAKVDTTRTELELAKEQAGTPRNETQEADIAAKQKAYEDSKDERDLLLAALQSRAETASESAAASRDVNALGGLDRTVEPEIADTLGRIQESFLAEDVPQLFVWSCLSELGLHRESQQNTVEMNQLFKDLVERWKFENSFVSADDRVVHTSAIIAAANMNRGSQLAQFCRDNFPSYLTVFQTNLQDFRLTRERLRTAVLLTEAQSQWLGEFGEAFKACGEGTSEVTQACQRAVITGSQFLTPIAPDAASEAEAEPDSPSEGDTEAPTTPTAPG